MNILVDPNPLFDSKNSQFWLFLSENEIFEEDSDSIKDEETNTFTNVDYKGFYNLTNPF